MYIYCISYNTFTFIQPGWNLSWAEQKSSGAVACQSAQFQKYVMTSRLHCAKFELGKVSYGKILLSNSIPFLEKHLLFKKAYSQNGIMEYHTPDDWKFKFESTNPFLFQSPGCITDAV